jgi:hypothetical protein
MKLQGMWGFANPIEIARVATRSARSECGSRVQIAAGVLEAIANSPRAKLHHLRTPRVAKVDTKAMPSRAGSM